MEQRKRTVVVTGAGSGIGQACVRRFLLEDARVIGLGVRPASRTCPEFEARPCDVRDPESVSAALADVFAIDVLVPCAGICETTPLDAEDALDVWRRVLATNLDGVFHTLRASLPALQVGGRIIVVASGLSSRARPGYAAYTASKHAILGLVKCAALELAARRITVNAVCPGWVETPMAAEDLARSAERRGQSVDQVRATATAAIPLGRFVEPDEVAALIAWLASAEADMVSGQAYGISGGEVM